MNPILRRIALWFVETTIACFIEFLLEVFIKIYNLFVSEYNLCLSQFDVEYLHGVTNYTDSCTSYEVTDILDEVACGNLISLGDTEDNGSADTTVKTSDCEAMESGEKLHLLTDSATEMRLITRAETLSNDFFESLSDNECPQVSHSINGSYFETEPSNKSGECKKVKNQNPFMGTAMKFIRDNFSPGMEDIPKFNFNRSENCFARTIFGETDFDREHANDLSTRYSYKELLVDYNESCFLKGIPGSNAEDDENVMNCEKYPAGSLKDSIDITEIEDWKSLENNTYEQCLQHKTEELDPIEVSSLIPATERFIGKELVLNHSDTYSTESLIDPKYAVKKEEWKSQMGDDKYKEMEVKAFNLLEGRCFNEDENQFAFKETFLNYDDNYATERPTEINTITAKEQWKSQMENNEYKTDRQLEYSNLLERCCFNADAKDFTDKKIFTNHIERFAIESFSNADIVTEREDWESQLRNNAYKEFKQQEFEDADFIKKNFFNQDRSFFDWTTSNDSYGENIFEINDVSEIDEKCIDNGHLSEGREEIKFPPRDTYDNSAIYNPPSSDSETRFSDKTRRKEDYQYVNSTTPCEINLEISDVTYTSHNNKNNGAIPKARANENKLTTKPDELENDSSAHNIAFENIGYNTHESSMVLNIDENNSDGYNLSSDINQPEITSDSPNKDTNLHFTHSQNQEEQVFFSSVTNTGDTYVEEIAYALPEPKEPINLSKKLFNEFDQSSYIVQEDIRTCTEIAVRLDLSQEVKANKKVHFDSEVKTFTYEPTLSIVENFNSDEKHATENTVPEMIIDNRNNLQDNDLTGQSEMLLPPRPPNPFMEEWIRHDRRIQDLFREGTEIPEFRGPAFEDITDIPEKELKSWAKLKHAHKASRKKKNEKCIVPYIKSDDPSKRLEKSLRKTKLDPKSMINKLIRKIIKK